VKIDETHDDICRAKLRLSILSLRFEVEENFRSIGRFVVPIYALKEIQVHFLAVFLDLSCGGPGDARDILGYFEDR
jgi:hypothetical protein